MKHASTDESTEITTHGHPFSAIGNPSSRVVLLSTNEGTTDNLIVCNSATDITVTLSAATGSNRIRQIANINDGVVTVEGNGADTINGELNQLLYNGDCMDIKDYETGKWVII